MQRTCCLFAPRVGGAKSCYPEHLYIIETLCIRPIGEVDGGLLQSSPIARRLAQLEARTDARFKAVFDALRDLLTPAEPMKKRGTGFTAHIEK